MASVNNYFKRYFEESNKVYGYDGYAEKGNEIFTYNYTKDDIVKILQSFDLKTKKKIMNMMIRIDFKNGDMQHYIDFLMDGYTKMQRGEKI